MGDARRGGGSSRPPADPYARRPDRLRQRELKRRTGRGPERMTPSFFGIPALTVAGWMAAAVGAVLLALLVLAMFNRILLKMALRNIPRRRAQTVLILFGLMLATLIITSSLAVGDTLSYSLVAIQLPQLGGVDEAFTRHPNHTPQGAATTDADFFSSAQTADVITRSKADPNVATALGVIVAPGAMVDTTSEDRKSTRLN